MWVMTALKLLGFFCVGLAAIMVIYYFRSKNFIRAERDAESNVYQIVPADLMYEGRKFSYACMYKIHCAGYQEGAPEFIDLSECAAEEQAGKIQDPNEEGSMLQWSSVGTLPHGDQIIYIYYSPVMRKEFPLDDMESFSGLYVIRRVDNTLQLVDKVLSGDHNAVRIMEDSFTFHGNQLTYSQYVTTFSFFHMMMAMFSDLDSIVEHKSLIGLGYGDDVYLGYVTYQATITQEGKFEQPQLISFTPEESVSDADKEGCRKEFEKIAPGSLSIDEALDVVTTLYQCKNINTLRVSQLKKMMEEVFEYVEAR
jgi:hypothetical protein